MVSPDFERLCRTVADATEGDFRPAGLKSLFRTLEKAALRADPKRRQYTENILDVVRGSIVFGSFNGMLTGLNAITKSKDSGFVVVRIKNRFLRPTPGSRCDGLQC